MTPAPAISDETANWKKMADSKTNISPNGSFTVIQQILADTQKIIIKNDQGKIITEDLVKEQYKEIGYNTRIRCMCATYFKDWVDDSKFSIKIGNGGGEEYEYVVDAKSGKVDGSSFKRIK